jgi:hypothetical protein
MAQSIRALKLELSAALEAGAITGQQADDYLETYFDDLMQTVFGHEQALQDIWDQSIPFLELLLSVMQADDTNVPFCRSIIALFRGDYQTYLEETQRFYAAKSQQDPQWLDWYAAIRYFVFFLFFSLLRMRKQEISK